MRRGGAFLIVRMVQVLSGVGNWLNVGVGIALGVDKEFFEGGARGLKIGTGLRIFIPGERFRDILMWG